MSENEKLIPVPAHRWADLIISARKGDMAGDLIREIIQGMNEGSISMTPEKKKMILTLFSKLQSYESQSTKA